MIKKLYVILLFILIGISNNAYAVYFYYNTTEGNNRKTTLPDFKSNKTVMDYNDQYVTITATDFTTHGYCSDGSYSTTIYFDASYSIDGGDYTNIPNVAFMNTTWTERSNIAETGNDNSWMTFSDYWDLSSQIDIKNKRYAKDKYTASREQKCRLDCTKSGTTQTDFPRSHQRGES